jgi:NAD(P)-dependent dehydrogenase (short-subunit alcohol dehydrogenase family)
MRDVLVVIGAGGMGQAIARRLGSGKTVLLADYNDETLQAVAASLTGDGYQVQARSVDVSSAESVGELTREAAALGSVTQVAHTAGLSPSQAPTAAILAVDLLGVALVLDEFAAVIAPGGAGVVIASMAGHLFPPLTPEQERAVATTPAQELLGLGFIAELT